ncbi:hypothetical protein CY34DRAFT_807731 [Suillus luteus UH-Slu-Lm8-n1]|uniref:Uncharacterized protein n=1 Tax=Suillus luteus UH-Slu-Lm8-n1 TaxID=930992 RepID=A0A0D0AE36_9AGAM|nr:hypothetical protein CY34DRAFT_807731 [Suillus luteus UH-Slu-Lm8-n1]
MLRNAKYVVHDGFPAVAWVVNYGNPEDWSSDLRAKPDRFMLWLRILPREPQKTGVQSEHNKFGRSFKGKLGFSVGQKQHTGISTTGTQSGKCMS